MADHRVLPADRVDRSGPSAAGSVAIVSTPPIVDARFPEVDGEPDPRSGGVDPASDLVGDDLSDAELAEMALAADPDALPDPDAVPYRPDGTFPELLPSWYMPTPASGARAPCGARSIVAIVILAFLVINALGLCITYGYLTIA